MISTPILLFFIAFITQYICEIYDAHNSPAVILEKIYENSKDFFKFIGRFIGTICSFLDWLKLRKLVDAFVHLTEPFFKILMSWVFLLIGFYEKAKEYSQPWMVYLGAIILLIIVAGILLKFTSFYEKIQKLLSTEFDLGILFVLFIPVMFVISSIIYGIKYQ